TWTFTAVGSSAAADLQLKYRFEATDGQQPNEQPHSGYYFNSTGNNEKWLVSYNVKHGVTPPAGSAGNFWFALKPDGSFWEMGSSSNFQYFIGMLPVSYYNDPQTLINAVQPAPPDLSGTQVTGNSIIGYTLHLNLNATYTNTFFVTLTASDG